MYLEKLFANSLLFSIILPVLIACIPAAISDGSCGTLDYFNEHPADLTPYYASFERSNFASIGNGKDKSYHSFYTSPDYGKTKVVYFTKDSGVKSYVQPYSQGNLLSSRTMGSTGLLHGGIGSSYYIKECNIRSKPAVTVGFHKSNSTVFISEIEKEMDKSITKKPVKIYKDSDSYFYKPQKRTTLELPEYYYRMEEDKSDESGDLD